MKYQNLVDEILDHADGVDHMHEIMDLVIGKAINQERIQIYKTLAIYFSELTEKNKAYLVKKIESNQVILNDRIEKLAENGVHTNINDFFDLEEGMEQIRVDRNLLVNHNTVEIDELVGERPPTRVYGNIRANDAPVGQGIYTTTATQAIAREFYADGRVVPVPRPAVNAIMVEGRTIEQRIAATLQELNIDPANVPAEYLEGLDDEDEQE